VAEQASEDRNGSAADAATVARMRKKSAEEKK
jgi:hypothetical protein